MFLASIPILVYYFIAFYYVQAATIPGFYEKANDMPSPRVLKSHFKLKFLPREIEEKRPKLIYIARNPKDVAVSFFNFTAMTSNCETSNDWSRFLNSFCQNTCKQLIWLLERVKCLFSIYESTLCTEQA